LNERVPVTTGQAIKGNCAASKQLPSADCNLIKDLLEGFVGIQGSQDIRQALCNAPPPLCFLPPLSFLTPCRYGLVLGLAQGLLYRLAVGDVLKGAR
jgi:hypothetical protein